MFVRLGHYFFSTLNLHLYTSYNKAVAFSAKNLNRLLFSFLHQLAKPLIEYKLI